jgi:hypothetical protein
MATCAFCGNTITKQSKKTRDHVPPECIFGENPNYNLITVPACGSCNEGTSSDDEYFKLIAGEYHAYSSHISEQVVDSTIRAMKNPAKAAFGQMVRSRMERVDLYSEAGLYLGLGGLLKMEYPRLIGTVVKTVRGLYYKHTLHKVPDGYQVTCLLIERLPEIPDEEVRGYWKLVITTMAEVAVTRQVGPKGGPMVFEYRYSPDPADPNTGYFLMRFFERFEFVGLVAPNGLDDAPGDVAA